MTGYILEMFGVSLALTLAIEMVVALIFKLRGRDLCLVLLANVLTNPAAVLLAWLFGSCGDVYGAFDGGFGGVWPTILFYFVLEMAVVITEGWIYRRRMDSLRHPLAFSLIANGCSFLIGKILEGFL